METSRRKWLQQLGLLSAGLSLAPFGVITSTAKEVDWSAPDKDGTVCLRYNENPYGPPPAARKAMMEHVGLSNRYPWQMIRDLMAAIAAKNNLSADNVLVGAGSTQIIDAVVQYVALRNSTSDQGNFILAEPTFDRWKSSAEGYGLKKIAVPLTAAKVHNLPAMLAAVNTNTRMVYLCNPNNPTGTTCGYDELELLVRRASRAAIVIVDEAYLDYSNERSLGSLVKDNEQLVVIKTFSKIYGMAGARIGYALGHQRTIDSIGAMQSGAGMGISAVSLAGALAALKDNEFVTDSAKKNEQAKAYTIKELARLNISCIPSDSNFIYFSLSKYQKDFFDLLKVNNIEGTGIFEEEGKWTRITVGTMDEMKKFISAIE